MQNFLNLPEGERDRIYQEERERSTNANHNHSTIHISNTNTHRHTQVHTYTQIHTHTQDSTVIRSNTSSACGAVREINQTLYNLYNSVTVWIAAQNYTDTNMHK